jgi:hypothetical protein
MMPYSELGRFVERRPQNWPPKYVFQHSYYPLRLEDHTLRYLLRPIMKQFSDGKVSHWWSWTDLPNDFQPQGEIVPGNPEAFSYLDENPLFHKLKAIKMSLGGWDKGYWLFPDYEKLTPQQLKRGWRFGFVYQDGSREHGQYSNIIQKWDTQVLAGPETFKIFGVDAYSLREIPLAIFPLSRVRPAIPIT